MKDGDMEGKGGAAHLQGAKHLEFSLDSTLKDHYLRNSFNRRSKRSRSMKKMAFSLLLRGHRVHLDVLDCLSLRFEGSSSSRRWTVLLCTGLLCSSSAQGLPGRSPGSAAGGG